MIISFDNPAWWLMCAALVPLLVHLVARTRPVVRRFSSVVLLRELVRLQSRHARPRDWLLLVLRTLLCASVAGAFLLPYLGGGADGEGGRALLLVLDDTASMAAADGQQVRMNRALSVAQSVVQNLATHDRVNLVTLAGYPRFVFDRPESARPLILRELSRTVSQPAAAADAAAALDSALAQLRDLPDGVQGQVLLISDFQSSTMQQAVEKCREHEAFCCVSVAQTAAVENTAVTAMALAPARPLPGQTVTLTVSLQHRQGTVPRKGKLPLSVTLSAGNLRLSQPCELDCGGQGSVQFELTAPQQPGDWLLTAQTESDAYPGDNTRYLVVPVADKLDCLAIAADRAQLGFMLRALENTPFLRTLYLPSVPENAADFVVWHAPKAADVPVIRERLAAGECILIVPDMVKDTALLPLLCNREGALAGEVRTDGGNWQVNISAPDSPAFALFSPDSLRTWAQAGVYRRLCPEPAVADGAVTLMEYAPAEGETRPVPALLRKQVGRGQLLVWNMPVTARDCRQGFSPLYLPLLAEQLLHSRASTDDSEPIAGQDFLQLDIPAGVSATDLRLQAADGTECPIVVQGGMARCEQAAMPGVYHWLAGENVLRTVAVNFPSLESDLRSFTPEGSTYLLDVPHAVQSRAFAGRVALWPALLGMALLFYVIELLVCRVPRERKTANSPS